MVDIFLDHMAIVWPSWNSREPMDEMQVHLMNQFSEEVFKSSVTFPPIRRNAESAMVKDQNLTALN